VWRVSLLAGVLIGELLHLDDRLQPLGRWAEQLGGFLHAVRLL